MALHPQDAPHLSRALTLAREAAAFASPNPTVGCVLTLNKQTIGEGAHLYGNRDHAEIAALKQASALGHSPLGATAYVTLEPCSHHGRTGPCADALIAAGIGRCVIATADPNPLVSGQGIAKLRAANIDVTLLDPSDLLAIQARRLNDAFAHSIQHHRPFVTLKAALSVDGKLAPPPNTRTSTSPHWLTGPAARADVHLFRHTSDAILTGIGTALADNPSLTDRTGLPRRRPLLRILLDPQLRLPLTSNLLLPPDFLIAQPQKSVISTEGPLLRRSGETPVFRTTSDPSPQPDLLIVCSPTASASNEAILTATGAEVLRLPLTNGQLDLHQLLRQLATRNILSLILEAGPTLNTAFLRANLVDKVVLYYTEQELGLDALPFAIGLSPYDLQQRLTHPTRATFTHATAEDIRIAGYLHDPWSPK